LNLYIIGLSEYKYNIDNENFENINSINTKLKHYHFNINKCLEKLKSLYPTKSSIFRLPLIFRRPFTSKNGGKRSMKKLGKLRGKKTRKLRRKRRTHKARKVVVPTAA
jgi:hypothetical protein